MHTMMLGVMGAALACVLPGPASAVTLPDACGSEKVQFRVTAQKGVPALAGLEEGRARIVLVETVDKRQQWCVGCSATTRIGMDGIWVGANREKSYFSFDVEPGEHHLCVNLQSRISVLRSKVSVAALTAEAGKTYYYETRITVKRPEDPDPELGFELKPLSEDEGKYAMKLSAESKAIVKP